MPGCCDPAPDSLLRLERPSYPSGGESPNSITTDVTSQSGDTRLAEAEAIHGEASEVPALSAPLLRPNHRTADRILILVNHPAE